MCPWGVLDVVQPGIGGRPWAVEVEHVACGRNLRKIKNAEVMLIKVLLVEVDGRIKRGEGGEENGGWWLDSVRWGGPGQDLLPVRPLDCLVVDWLWWCGI